MTKRFYKLTIAFISIFCCAVYAQAQQSVNIVTTAVPFLRINPDARGGAMGDAGIATLPDANSSYWNIAKTPFLKNNSGLSLNYTPWLKDLGLNDVYLASLAGFYKIDDNQAISASLRYFSLGNIVFTDYSGNTLSSYRPREFAFDAGYSIKLSDNLALGVAARYINSSLASGDVNNSGVVYKAGTSIAADLGLYYNGIQSDGHGFSWGIALSNLGTKIGYTSDAKNKDFIPANFGIGAAYTSVINESSKITFALDINKLLVPAAPQATGNTTTDSTLLADYRNQSVMSSWFKSFGDGTSLTASIQASLGAEFWYDNKFALRAGYFYQDKSSGRNPFFSVGAGIKYDFLGVNLSYLVPSGNGITRNPLSNTLRLGISFDLDGNKATY
ncbi:MAG: type IX secretion system outer membrane channel protein PorV [Bacteroidetes bacterium]|nr:type IX secretion system outer membrane channel protein PorV [Bacteroidota bacterium]MBS1649808.1 type IX secretion system outer membrane channel protein PorV [Bacteroidota bacterium]